MKSDNKLSWKFFDNYSISTLYLLLQIITVASNFVSTPLIITGLGNETYVLWLTINSFSALILLADWGFLNTFRIRMTKIYIENHTFSRVIWRSVVKYMHLSTVLITLLLILSSRWLPFYPEDSVNRSRILLVFGFLAAYATLYEHLYLLKFQIHSSEASALSIMLSFRTLEGFAQVTILLVHPSIYLILISALFFRSTSLGALACFAHQKFKIPEPTVDYEASTKGVIKNSAGGFMFVLSNVLYANVLTLILSIILSTNLLVIFQLTKMLVSPIRMISSAIATGTLQQNLKKTQINISTFSKSNFNDTFSSFGFLLVISILLSIFSARIWNQFFPNETIFRFGLLFFLIIQYLLDSLIWLISRDFFNGNRLLRIGILNLIISLLGVASVPQFTDKFGVLGVPLALILFDMIMIMIITNPKGRVWLFQSV